MLYHKKIGFPKSLNILETYTLEVVLSNHAKQACLNDRYGVIDFSHTVSFVKNQIIEIETFDNKKAEKIVVRVPYNNDCDLVMAIQISNSLIKTVWLNKKSDAHGTLDRFKYDNPNQQQFLKKIKF